MFTLIYQLFAAGIRHRSSGMEIGAFSPFWEVKKHRQQHILRCCVDCACGPEIKKKGCRVVGHSILVYKLIRPAKQLFRRRTRVLP